MHKQHFVAHLLRVEAPAFTDPLILPTPNASIQHFNLGALHSKVLSANGFSSVDFHAGRWGVAHVRPFRALRSVFQPEFAASSRRIAKSASPAFRVVWTLRFARLCPADMIQTEKCLTISIPVTEFAVVFTKFKGFPPQNALLYSWIGVNVQLPIAEPIRQTFGKNDCGARTKCTALGQNFWTAGVLWTR